MKYFSSFDELWAHCQPALEGGSKLYVEKAGQKREFATRRELSILDHWAGGATIVTGGAERAVLLKAEMQPYGRENAKAVFVAASPNRIEVARGVPLAGEGRRFFRKAYLEPAGLRDEETAFLYMVPRVLKRAPSAEEIEAWRPWLTKQLQELNPEIVVALGKQSCDALAELADLTMPHPHAVLKHGDKGEVSRKASMLKQLLSAKDTDDCRCCKSIAGEEIRCPILKADIEKRLVYSVIAEPDTVDAQGDVMSAETIEIMAHNYMLNSRKFDNKHDWRAVDATPVESWIQREATILLGEKIKANSWVVGAKVFADHIWQKVLSGEYQSFSIGGRGVRVPRVRFG